jgi:hypothetical protein
LLHRDKPGGGRIKRVRIMLAGQSSPHRDKPGGGELLEWNNPNTEHYPEGYHRSLY